MRSVMKHKFSEVPRADIPRSSFDRSHAYKSTFNAGWLVPIFFDEALPGDTMNVRVNAFMRLNTPIFPIMDNIFVDSFFFAVPNRLLWDNWEKFNGAQDNPSDSTDFLIPELPAPAGGWTIDSLSDFFAIPTGVDNLNVSAFWHRAYNLIWNEWFRDENLQDSVPVSTDDGPDDPADYVVLNRGKRFDYFTSCLPWPQKGPTVDVPIGTSAPVSLDPTTTGTAQVVLKASNHTGIGSIQTLKADTNSDFAADTVPAVLDPLDTLIADLSNATAATINQLRESFQIQRMLERDARGGTRYTEVVKAHFGVTSPDARLQRPEYLGGGSSAINITPIAQTQESGGATPLGTLAGIGTGSFQGHGFNKSFTEHCTIIGMVSARADLTYQQGLDRMWSRRTRFDFYWPALSHLGEQAVLSKEIFADGTAADDDVFGYQERWAEYRFKPSRITSILRSSAAQSLDAWHLSQDFATRPTLSDQFITDNPPIDRIVAVPSEPDFIFDSYIQYRCARPMPTYSVPGLIDHF